MRDKPQYRLHHDGAATGARLGAPHVMVEDLTDRGPVGDVVEAQGRNGQVDVQRVEIGPEQSGGHATGMNVSHDTQCRKIHRADP